MRCARINIQNDHLNWLKSQNFDSDYSNFLILGHILVGLVAKSISDLHICFSMLLSNLDLLMSEVIT